MKQTTLSSPSSAILPKIILSVAAIVVILFGVNWASSILNPILIGIFMAVLVRPFYQWLERKHIPSGLALLLTVLSIVLIGGGLIFFVILSFTRLANGLSGYTDQIAANLEELSSLFASVDFDPSTLLNSENISSILLAFAGAIASLFATALLVLFLILFAIAEAPRFGQRMRDSVGDDSQLWLRTQGFISSITTYFLLRTKVNLVTGTMVTVMLLVLGIDYAVLWGVLTFFLSYVPYIGIFVATIPSVVLAFAEGGIVLAVVVIIGVTIINGTAENLVAPSMMGRGLSLSPLLVFVAFIFWAWLLGVAGTLMAMPITVAMVLVLDAFDETRWLARLCGFGGMGNEDVADHDGSGDGSNGPQLSAANQ